MEKYFKMLKISLQSTFVYRQNYIISSFINILSILIVIFLWQGVYLFNKSIKLYSLPAMILYIFIVNTIFQIINTSEISSRVSDDIRLGTLSIYLIRPFSYFFSQLADITGSIITKIPMIIILNGIVGLFFIIFSNIIGNIGFSLSIISVLLFLIFILLSFIWNYLFDYLLGTLGFWVDNPWIIFYIKGHVLSLICGLVVPIDLFPSYIKNVLEFLPFQYYVFFPYKVLIGAVSLADCIMNLLLFIGWIVGISIITFYVWKKSIKKYTAAGG